MQFAFRSLFPLLKLGGNRVSAIRGRPDRPPGRYRFHYCASAIFRSPPRGVDRYRWMMSPNKPEKRAKGWISSAKPVLGFKQGLNRRIPASCVPCKNHNWDRWCDWAWGVHSSNRTATSVGAQHHGCDACGNGISTVASLEDTFYQPLNYSKHPVYVRPPCAVDSTGA